MLPKKFVLAAALWLVIMMIAVSAQAARPTVSTDTVIWELKNTQVVDPGQTVQIPADEDSGFPGGTLTTGYILEAKAKTKSGKLVPEGTFRLTLSAFKPDRDMPFQKAGWWHIQGDWTVVDKNVTKEAKKARHNPYTVAGKIQTALLFNPAQASESWSAAASVPMSLAAGQWARGSQGSLNLNSRQEGELFLILKLWPKGQ